jgi:uncharacterized protein DUF4382
MNRNKTLLISTLLVSFGLAACSGKPGGVVCKVNCGGGGNATVSFTLAAVPFTPPPSTSILSFALTISGISLTPASGGNAVNIPLNAATFIVDLTRLQSDSAFLGQVLANVPAGTYNKITVGVTGVVVTYCTDLGGTSGCDTNSVAQVLQALTTPTTSSFSATFTNNQQAAVQIQFNFGKAITISGTQPQVVSKVDLTTANVMTASTLAPTSSTSSLAAGQLDFVDDVTGVVTAASTTSVTVQTSTHGSIIAKANSSSLAVTNCVTTNAACPPAVGQFASIDAVLNADGTFTLVEFDPIAPTSSDWIEGILTTTPSSSTQFQIVTNDISLASTGSLIGANLSVGAPVKVTLSNTVKSFLVDGKGFPVPAASNFAGSVDASVIVPGQTVALHVTGFTAASGAVPASATVDTVVLRFTRVAGAVSTVAAAILNIQSLPPFFGPALTYEVQLSSGSPSTNYDGVPDASSLGGQNASIRALYFGPTVVPAFSAAKVRKQ